MKIKVGNWLITQIQNIPSLEVHLVSMDSKLRLKLKSDFFSMTEWEVAHDEKKKTTLIFNSEIPYGESINVVQFFFQSYFYFAENSQKL